MREVSVRACETLLGSLEEERVSPAEWLADLCNEETQAEALADLREYLLRAVFLYLDRHREDLTHLDRRELEFLADDFAQEALLQIQAKLDTFRGESKFTTWAYRFVKAKSWIN